MPARGRMIIDMRGEPRCSPALAAEALLATARTAGQMPARGRMIIDMREPRRSPALAAEALLATARTGQIDACLLAAA